MSSISEQISVVTKTALANPLAVINAFSKTAFGSMEKIVALNMHAVKQSLESSTAATRELFSANKPQELIALSTAQAQPQIAQIVAYGRELAQISTQTRNEFLANFAQSEKIVTAVVSHQSTQPLGSTPVAKLVKKSAVKIEAPANTKNTQLPLLADAEIKVAKKTAAQAKKLPTLSKTNTLVTPAEIKTVIAKPTAASKPAAKKTEESTVVEPSLVVKANIKPATKVLDSKPAAKPEVISPIETAPAAESTLEKKSAVKMPFPASPIKKAASPTFPAVSTRPAYKAKTSAATGAKKRVRQ